MPVYRAIFKKMCGEVHFFFIPMACFPSEFEARCLDQRTEQLLHEPGGSSCIQVRQGIRMVGQQCPTYAQPTRPHITLPSSSRPVCHTNRAARKRRTASGRGGSLESANSHTDLLGSEPVDLHSVSYGARRSSMRSGQQTALGFNTACVPLISHIIFAQSLLFLFSPSCRYDLRVVCFVPRHAFLDATWWRKKLMRTEQSSIQAPIGYIKAPKLSLPLSLVLCSDAHALSPLSAWANA